MNAGVKASALLCDHVTVSYMQKPVLRDVSMELPAGTLISITGPNGSGKTTLLRAILGLLPIDTGRILVFGEPIDKIRRRIAYVPQTETVDWDFPITAREVVMMGRYPWMGWFHRAKAEDEKAVDAALETVGMRDFSSRHIRQLSGGQQQRIFLARALAQQAEMLILDEPFTGIDARTEQTLFELIHKLAEQGKTLLVVNHNLSLLEHFDILVLLNRTVIAAGPTKEILTQENLQLTYGGRMVLVDYAEQILREGKIDLRR